MDRLYVYALVDERLPRTTLFGHTIQSIPVGDIFALAERRTLAPDASEKNLREQHSVVLKLAARAPAILPARFGSLVDAEELRQIVSLRGAALRAALALVRGREQMTVRLLGDDRARALSLEPKQEGATRRRGAGTRYLDARRVAAGYPLPDAVHRIAAAMKDLVVAGKAEPGREGVRATIYHLIAQGGSGRYREALAEASADVVPFTVAVSGPWPPFAFAPELLG